VHEENPEADEADDDRVLFPRLGEQQQERTDEVADTMKIDTQRQPSVLRVR
jgi:hypothetical protein